MIRAAHAGLTAWPVSRMFDALGEHRLDGFALPLAEQPLEPLVFPQRVNEPLGFFPGQFAVDKPALLEASPFIVRPMARGWIVGTATAWLAAYAGPMLKRACADIVQSRQLLLNLGNPLPRVGAQLRRFLWGGS